MSGGFAEDGREVASGRRRLFVVPVRDDADADVDADFRDGIDEQVATVSAWWCGRATLGDRAFTSVPANGTRTRRDLERFIHDSGMRDATPGDVLVLYVTGHGYRASSGAHDLLVPRGDGARPVRDGFRTVDLAAVLDSDAEHVLVIVNASFADALRDESELGERLGVHGVTISQIENLTRRVYADELPGICTALGVTPVPAPRPGS